MINDEVLKQVAAQSASMRELMRKLNLSQSGQTSKRLAKQMQEINVTLNKTLAPIKDTMKKVESQVLIADSLVSQRTLKRFILDNNLLDNRCYAEGCPSPEPVWNGQPLVLQLEHKNGVSNDNRLENLEMLCPNCHTQTKTWGSKSRA